MAKAETRTADLERAARLYYEHDLTHQQIGDLLGVSRVKVTRMLADARAAGLIRIRVLSDVPLFEELAAQVKEKYSLSRVWVAPSGRDTEQTASSVATVAAHVLDSYVRPRSTVAVALSHSVALALPRMSKARLDILAVPATGQLMTHADGASSMELSLYLAQLLGGTAMTLPAPLLAGSSESAQLFLQEGSIAAALARAAQADLLVCGLGSVPGHGLLMSSIDEREVDELVAAGAVGDIAAIFFDRDGRPVKTPLTERLVTVPFDGLLGIKHRLGIGYGADRAEAIDVAARHGLITRLVTDTQTVQALLSLPTPSVARRPR